MQHLQGGWCFFIGVHFLVGFMCGSVRLVFVGRRLWLGTERFVLLAVGFYDLLRGAVSLVLSIGGCSICKGGGAFLVWLIVASSGGSSGARVRSSCGRGAESGLLWQRFV